MNRTILSLFIVLSSIIHAQESTIEQWQKAHPSVVFVNIQDVSSFSENFINSSEVVVYTNEISMNDINRYEERNVLKNNISLDGDYIKRWLAENPDIKILPKNYFNQLSPEKQTLYVENGAMVLEKEVITLKDILNYEANH